jgi:hypothetical protein
MHACDGARALARAFHGVVCFACCVQIKAMESKLGASAFHEDYEESEQVLWPVERQQQQVQRAGGRQGIDGVG